MAGAVTTVPGPIGVPWAGSAGGRRTGGRRGARLRGTRQPPIERCGKAQTRISRAPVGGRLRLAAYLSGRRRGGRGISGGQPCPQAARARRSARRATPGRARVVEASISRSPVSSSITVAPGPACARPEHRLQPFPRRRAAEEDRRLSACGVAGSRGGRRRVRPCQPGTTCSTRGPSRPSARASRTTCSTRGFTNGGKRRGPVSHGLAVEPARTGWRRCAGSREDPGVDDPRCRANQHDRVLAGGKARRYAPPPLRGADGLDTGCAHGHRQSLPDSPGTLFSQEGPEFDV